MAQPNVINLSVDAANDGNPSTEAYTNLENFQNRSVFIGADHTLEVRNMMGLYRTWPTKSGNFKGTMKTSVKFTQDLVVPAVDGGDLTAPEILEVSFSTPVGATAADRKHLRQRVIAALDDDTFMESLAQGQI